MRALLKELLAELAFACGMGVWFALCFKVSHGAGWGFALLMAPFFVWCGLVLGGKV